MAKILITGLMRQFYNASPAVTSFANGYFSFGDSSGSLSGLQTYNRTISKSTSTESTRTVMSTSGRMPQGASGFSSTDIYQIKGYLAGLSTTVNKVVGASDSQSSPTITFTVERRGPFAPCTIYLGRIYYFGGYRDTDSTYRNDTTYITTSTDSATNDSNITAARHAGTSLFNNTYSWLIGGYTTGGGSTTTIYKWIFASSSISTISATDVSGGQGYGLNSFSIGYRVAGAGPSYNNNKKLTYATDTLAAIANSPDAEDLYSGTQYVTSSEGYCWTGWRGTTLKRTLHKLTFSTETWTNGSYTTADTNSGWVQGTGGF
jgi:hypothetical protein